MTARVVYHAVSGGSKMLIVVIRAMRRGKGMVKRARHTLLHALIDSGIPKADAKEISEVYALVGMEFLSITKMMKMAEDLSEE